MSILGEIVTQILGEAVVEGFRKNRKLRPPFREGESNASLGTIAAFGGTLAFLFGLLGLLGLFNVEVYRGIGRWVLLEFASGALVVSWFSRAAGRRAPKVTRRNLGLARFGVRVASLGLVVSACGLSLWLVRLIQWYP